MVISIKENIICNNELLDSDSKLLHITSLVKEGFTSGYYPGWELAFTGIRARDISDCSLEHISQCVAIGYKEGEIIEESEGGRETERGWWKIKL